MARSSLERHYQTIIDSINEGVFTIDANWRITTFNRAAQAITGLTREQALGKFCGEVFHSSICDTACALKSTMASGEPVVNAYAYILNQAGNRIPIRISTALLRDARGNITGGVETFQDITQIEQLQKALTERYTFEDIAGRSSVMLALFRVLPQIADSDSTVLIEGPSGTGKELFAKALHNLSHRRKKRFVAVNCGALPDTLLESELFGYEAGAFTGARRAKPGKFTLAHGGTLFLDEIGDISPALQVRLLRVLQDRWVDPLGAVAPIKVDVRIVAATNKNMTDLVKSGRFREDLFYRIQVVHLKIPALKERREDIPLLIDHLVAKFNRLKAKDIPGVSNRVLNRLMVHDFPGNVRELENIIEHAFVLCPAGLIQLEHLPPELRPDEGSAPPQSRGDITLRSSEKWLIEKTLEENQGNRRQTAEQLGIDPSTLYRKIKSLRITPPGMDGRRRRSR